MVLQKLKFPREIIFVLIMLSYSILFASELDSLSTESQPNSYSISVGYWNDNFLFDKELNKFFKKNIFQTNDDFITASFWLRFSKLQ